MVSIGVSFKIHIIANSDCSYEDNKKTNCNNCQYSCIQHLNSTNFWSITIRFPCIVMYAAILMNITINSVLLIFCTCNSSSQITASFIPIQLSFINKFVNALIIYNKALIDGCLELQQIIMTKTKSNMSINVIVHHHLHYLIEKSLHSSSKS